MDPWLRRHLANTGVMTEEGITRKARPRRCRRCNAVIIVGLDADQCAVQVHADPTPLNAAGELLALAEGRRTLSLLVTGGGRVLEPRRPEDIRRLPPQAPGVREDVLREHRCGTPPPPEPTTCTSVFTHAAASLPPNSPPPF